MCPNEMPAWAMLTFGAVVLVGGIEMGWAMARINDLWHFWKTRRSTPHAGQEESK